ncbi:MAG: VanZ family protein [Anaerolineales bacterium]
MKKETGIKESRFDLKIILWAAVAVYTVLLPFFIFVYRAILNSFGKEVVGKIPLAMVAILGILYSAAVLRNRKNWRYLLFLIPCGIITYLIMKYEPNPNKHIHIPEYTLMAWLLFAVLSRNYEGRGIFLLIFFYASLLGVVDELEQGILPSRFYGWSDMLVNSSSSIIGIFTILGLIKIEIGTWGWVRSLKEFKGFVALNLFGLTGAALMCIRLFQVQAGEKFWGIYPVWLWAWSLLFIITASVIVIARFFEQRRIRQTDGSQSGEIVTSEKTTAQLWVYPLLAILFYMHGLLIFLSATGIEFK